MSVRSSISGTCTASRLTGTSAQYHSQSNNMLSPSNILRSDKVEMNSPPATPISPSSLPSLTLIQLASTALQPATHSSGPNDSCSDRDLRPLDTASECAAGDDAVIDLLRHATSLHFSSSSILPSSLSSLPSPTSSLPSFRSSSSSLSASHPPTNALPVPALTSWKHQWDRLHPTTE